MKKVMLMVAAVAMIAFTSCKDEGKVAEKMTNKAETELAQTTQDGDSATDQFPELEFDQNRHDFGTVTEGDVVEHEFTFTNTGNAPLKVMKANPSCGCTVPDWSKDPIAPGEKGSMVVKFDTRGKLGKQNKSVRLTTNTKKGNETLTFSAVVEKK